MYIGRAYGIHPQTGRMDYLPSVISIGRSDRALERRLSCLPGIIKVSVNLMSKRQEELCEREGFMISDKSA